MTLHDPYPSRPALLVWQDGEGGRLVGLAPPPGRKPQPLFRFTSLGAHLLALALTQPVSGEAGELVPVELVATEGFS